jgi:colanic acid biosynthesis glycosyl transferase WcaI
LKILISSFVYYPEAIGLREHDLASGLVDLGHQVFVITGLPSYPAGVVYAGYQDEANKWEIVNGVRIYRIPFVGARGRSSIRRIWSLVLFTFFTIRALYSQKIRPDIVRAYQFGLPGYLVSFLRDIPFFLDVQDMWPEWAKATNFSLSEILYKILDWQQKQIYKKAYKITTISKRFKKHLESKGVPANKIFILSNWAGSNNFKVVPRDMNLGIQEDLTGKFNIIYAGNIGSAQGIDVILRSAEVLGNSDRFQFIVIGDGLEKDNLQHQAHKMGLETVRFIGRKPPESLSQYLAWADVLLLPLKKNPMYEVTIPSKTFTYLACGRPILVAANGDVAELISEIGAGIVVPPENPKAIALAIRNLMSMEYSQREQYGKNAQIAYQKHYDSNVLIRKYDQLIRE